MSADYLQLTAGVSLAAVGVHAHAAARAAALATNGLISRGDLLQRGMTAGVEHELLQAGLLSLAGGDALLVTIEPLTRAEVALQARRAGDAARQRSRREKPAASGQMSRESRDSRDSRDSTQFAGPTAAPDTGTSHTRASVRAAHTPSHPPLLNVLNGNDSETTHTVVRAVRDALARGFTTDEISDVGVDVAVDVAQRAGVDPVDAALKAAAMGASKTWRTRDAATTMEIAVRKLTTLPGAAAHGRTAAPGACPRAAGDQHAQLRDQVLELLADQVDDNTFGLWIAPLQIHTLEQTTVELAAPAALLSMLRDRFTGTLAAAFTEIAGRHLTVDVVSCSCATAQQTRRSA